MKKNNELVNEEKINIAIFFLSGCGIGKQTEPSKFAKLGLGTMLSKSQYSIPSERFVIIVFLGSR